MWVSVNARWVLFDIVILELGLFGAHPLFAQSRVARGPTPTTLTILGWCLGFPTPQTPLARGFAYKFFVTSRVTASSDTSFLITQPKRVRASWNFATRRLPALRIRFRATTWLELGVKTRDNQLSFRPEKLALHGAMSSMLPGLSSEPTHIFLGLAWPG